MEITLNHTIVYSYDNVQSAKFYERVFGFTFIKTWGHFAVLKINSTLTFDFMNKEKFTKQHYAFKVNDIEFEEIYQKIKDENIIYGSDPYNLDNMKINHSFGGKGLYFKDPNGHVLEILTTDYVLD